MAINSVLGSDQANAYISAMQADAYFANTFNLSRWNAFATSDKEIALIMATKNLEVLDYYGTKCDPSTTDPARPQSLQWPRSGVTVRGYTWLCNEMPPALAQATAMLALELAENPTAIAGGGAAVGSIGAVKEQKLGELSQSFYDVNPDTSVSTKVSATAPLVLQKFPWLVDVLNGYFQNATSSGARVVERTL